MFAGRIRGREIWHRLLFHDYLRTQLEKATRYAAPKRNLAAWHCTDREAYTAAKSA